MPPWQDTGVWGRHSIVGKTWWWGPETAGHIASTVRKQRAECWSSSDLFHFPFKFCLRPLLPPCSGWVWLLCKPFGNVFTCEMCLLGNYQWIYKLKKSFPFLLWVWVWVSAFISVYHVHCVPWSQTVVSYHVGAGNRTLVLLRATRFLTTEPFLQLPI